MKFYSIILCITLAGLFSCKDKDEVGKGGFDLRNPVGNYLYVEMGNKDGTSVRKALLEFAVGNTFKYYDPGTSPSSPIVVNYLVIDGNILELSTGMRFVIEDDGSVTPVNENIRRAALVRNTSESQLTGRTFSGTYLTRDAKVLHQHFFYSFSKENTQIDAGFLIGNVTRSGTYHPIGNAAAIAEVPGGNGDVEFMVLVDDKLEVDYFAKSANTRHNGSFSEAK